MKVRAPMLTMLPDSCTPKAALATLPRPSIVWSLWTVKVMTGMQLLECLEGNCSSRSVLKSQRDYGKP